MAKYVYPAIFTPEEKGMFSIRFPDIEGCFTCGDTLEDGIDMAKDALSLMLTHLEDTGRNAPAASAINSLAIEDGEFTTYVSCDTAAYRRLIDSSAVKKTLSIPSWLNESATAAGINFSQVLQDALKQQLNIV